MGENKLSFQKQLILFFFFFSENLLLQQYASLFWQIVVFKSCKFQGRKPNADLGKKQNKKEPAFYL
jgi:hypothetical protein